jgi:N-acetylneuraminic acid mutarotase
LNDCHIFKIETQSWSVVDIEPKEGRAGHCASIDDHRLMIFGGYNETGFLSADFSILEIDSMVAYRNKR